MSGRNLIHTLLIVLFVASVVRPEAVHAEPSGRRGGNQDQIIRSGMLVLGSWAVANIAGGAVGYGISESARANGFWQMNALWNTVNLGLAGTTLVARDRASDPSGEIALDLPAYREESHRFEKVLLFNVGSDLGYMALGGWMWERGSRGYGLDSSGVSAERLEGWGQALVLQGGFLLVFDLVLARLLATDRRQTESGGAVADASNPL